MHFDLLCCHFREKHPLLSTQGLQICKILFVGFDSLPALLDRLNGHIGHAFAVKGFLFEFSLLLQSIIEIAKELADLEFVFVRVHEVKRYKVQRPQLVDEIIRHFRVSPFRELLSKKFTLFHELEEPVELLLPFFFFVIGQVHKEVVVLLVSAEQGFEFLDHRLRVNVHREYFIGVQSGLEVCKLMRAV